MTNYGTLIDNTLHPAPNWMILHGAMVTNPKAKHFAALNGEPAPHGNRPTSRPISRPSVQPSASRPRRRTSRSSSARSDLAPPGPPRLLSRQAQRDVLLQTACIPFSTRVHSPFKTVAISQS